MADNYPITLDLEGIKEILPQRDPFLFLDEGKITDVRKAKGWKTFPKEWEIFKGHFPGHPVVPGVILQEILGQTTSLLLKVSKEFEGLIGIFRGVKNLRYGVSVHPNELIHCEVEITAMRKTKIGIVGIFKGIGKVEENMVIEMEAFFAAVPPEKMDKV